jgi:molybdopterin-guanine dinucleotide biosynthesis protein A
MTAETATLIILAGGDSKRMGTPKHLLPTPAGTVIDHLHQRLSSLFVETLVVGGRPTPSAPGIRTIEDLYPARSPLVGVYSGLLCARTDLSLVVACDMPFVRPALVQALLSHSAGVDVVVARVGGYYEPLCAVYRRSALPTISKALGRGELKVAATYASLRLREVSETEAREYDSDLLSFLNLNTPRELALLARLGKADRLPSDLLSSEPQLLSSGERPADPAR